VALRIIETATGPILVDDEPVETPSSPTRLEALAAELGMDADSYRDLLRNEVQRRRRERGDAWNQLDETIAKRANGR
jgi:hypothetical protein